MERRTFMRGVAASSAAALFARGARSARAFGEVPDEAVGQLLPTTARNVLEIHLLGGVSQYESFYAVEGYGDNQADPQQLYLFLNSPEGDIQSALDSCGVDGQTPLLQEFAPDEQGATVNLGPFVLPLRARPDIVDRMRIVATRHIGAPHEVAIPLLHTGRVPGNLNAAGLGAHVRRYFQERDGNDLPSSFVLLPPDAVQRQLVASALAVGIHPGTARPIGLRVDDPSLLQLVNREGVGSRRAGHDALVDAMQAQMDRRLVHPSTGEQVSAELATNYRAATSGLKNIDGLSGLLEPSLFEPLAGQSCGLNEPVDTTTMSIRLAAHLLRQESTKHVCVVDGGFENDLTTAGAYDSHEQNSTRMARNLRVVLSALTEVINAPTENDPSKLDLDETLIIISSEFGRTPFGTGDAGRGHWPQGYPTMYIGGPLAPGARSVFGALGPQADATSFVSPVEHRVAALLALGVWPFDPASFNVADVTGTDRELEAAQLILQKVFGYTA